MACNLPSSAITAPFEEHESSPATSQTNIEIDYLVVHGRQDSKFPMVKGQFPNGNLQMQEENKAIESLEKAFKRKRSSSNPSYLWNIDVSSQLEECQLTSREKEYKNYLKYSSEPLRAIFQIGRSDEPFIDFHVMKPFNLNRTPWNSRYLNRDSHYPNCHEERDSTISSVDSEDEKMNIAYEIAFLNRGKAIGPISRFACRIEMNVQKLTDAVGRTLFVNESKIYAGGFDSNFKIRIGDNNKTWCFKDPVTNQMKCDGLARNPVLLLTEKKIEFGCISPRIRCFAEVSVQGILHNVHCHGEKRASGPSTWPEDNTLVDGSMIYFSGGALLWRTGKGISQGPSCDDLRQQVVKLNSRRHQCPVSFATLYVPFNNVNVEGATSNPDDDFRNEKQSSKKKQSNADATDIPVPAFVYINCGHVQGNHVWENGCPLCKQEGPKTSLKMGYEPAFWVDKEPPTHIFNPCGHMASEKTVRYWLSIPIPKPNSIISYKACPFCGAKVIDEGIQKLHFP